MCGIFCIYNRRGFGFNSKELINKYIQNGKMLNHRGNSENYRIINQKLLLFQNRLSDNDKQILTNNQIMIITDGTIYNYKELYDIIKQELPNYKFKSESNSEIIIPMYLLYGSAFINKIRGMYSIILFDMNKNIILAARDHIGILSLYYADENDTIMFSSEMKSLVNLSKNIKIFEPGQVFINRSFFNSYITSWNNKNNLSTEIVNYDEIKQKLISCVLSNTISDKPIGILLNGDFNSSLIAAIMVYLKKNKLINIPIKTFTIGLEDAIDIITAEKVSDYLQTEHSTYNFDILDAVDVLENVIYHLETYDILTIRKAIPLYLLSMQIKEDSDIKVLFSGDVANDIFGSHSYSNREEMQYELIDKINSLHKNDLLGAHKAIIANTIELRIPFGDQDFINYVMSIDPKYKMINSNGENNIDKYILRKAFDDGKFLPKDVLWKKEEESIDNKKLNDGLKEYAEKEITNVKFEKRSKLFPINTPISKEGFLYRKIFESFYKNDSCIKTVDNNINSIN